MYRERCSKLCMQHMHAYMTYFTVFTIQKLVLKSKSEGLLGGGGRHTASSRIAGQI